MPWLSGRVGYPVSMMPFNILWISEKLSLINTPKGRWFALSTRRKRLVAQSGTNLKKPRAYCIHRYCTLGRALFVYYSTVGLVAAVFAAFVYYD